MQNMKSSHSWVTSLLANVDSASTKKLKHEWTCTADGPVVGTLCCGHVAAAIRQVSEIHGYTSPAELIRVFFRSIVLAPVVSALPCSRNRQIARGFF